jgi:hypothetical protein
MDAISLALLLAAGIYLLKTLEQRQRIAFLASHLGRHPIERLMAQLNEGYLRALGETDPERQAAIWQLHDAPERQLAREFQQFADRLAQTDAATTRIERNGLPFARRWLPAALTPSVDLRALMTLHAQGIDQVVNNTQALDARRRARTLLAELYLMQHSCHWFCRSRRVASARLLARHQTSHAQLLETVSPATRATYLALVGP